MSLFRERLRSGTINNKLVCVGYSFNDDHITEAIIDAARQQGNNLSVYAFVGPESYKHGNFTEHKLRLQRIEVRCPGRFNAYVGEHFYVGDALDDDQSKALLNLSLWRFENLVSFVAGEPA
jgi:SIR2-like domain